MKKVKILKQASSGLSVATGKESGLNFNANPQWFNGQNKFAEPDIQVNKTLKPVELKDANLEAEKGETAVADMTGDGIPGLYKIGGARHYNGGTPLNLPEDSFIFSRDKKMKISGPILESFGKRKDTKDKFTPAEISNQYQINDFRKVLADPNTDKMQRDTAEAMIANYNLKLAKLGLVQESTKGFPDGIPAIAMPYIDMMNIDPGQFISPNKQEPSDQVQSAQYGGMKKYQTAGVTGPTGGSQIETMYMNATSDEEKQRVLSYIKKTNPTLAEKLISAIPEAIIGQYQAQWPVYKKAASIAGNIMKRPFTMSKEIMDAAVNKLTSRDLPVNEENIYNQLNTLGSIGATGSVGYDSSMDTRGVTSSDIHGTTGNPDTLGYSKLSDAELKKIAGIKDLGGESPKYQDGGPTPEQKAAAIAILESRKKTKSSNPHEAGNFDVYDFRLREEAAKHGYDFINPADEFRYQKSTVGSQGRNTGYKVDPESGFKYKDIKPGKAGLDDFVKRHKDIIDTYPGGESAWRKDQLAGAGKTNPAMTFVVDANNKKYKDATGYDLVSNQPGRYIPGVELFNMPGMTKKAPSEAATITTTKPDGTINTTPIPQAEIPAPYKTPRPQWWLQDEIKTAGAFGDWMRIKKYNPWQATPGTYYGERTFYDPNRELAANAEQVNMGIQGASTFSGPQSFAATAAYLQGQGAKSAADTMGRYNNMNVQAANQLSDMNTGIANQASQQRAASATQLYDKQTIANQQFDNSKNMARQNLRSSFIDAITNRANTYDLNTLYPQYAIDPSTGGMVYNPTGSGRRPTKELKGTFTPLDYLRSLKGEGLTDEEKKLLFNATYGKGKYADTEQYPQGYPG